MHASLALISPSYFQKLSKMTKPLKKTVLCVALCIWTELTPIEESTSERALEQIQQGHFASAYTIFQELCASFPENTHHLFHAGRLAAWLNEWEESESLLKKCLILDSNYIDAAVQLGHVYLYNQRWAEAEELFARYPNYMPAKAALAKSALWQGDYPLAEERYRDILGDAEFDQEARLGLARALAQQQKYREASVQYAFITQPEFQGTLVSPERFAVASRTRISTLIDANYMESKESDPQLKAPVAKDYGFATSLSIFFPVTDRWRLDVRGAFYHQKENNIYPPAVGVNYDALLGELGIASHCYFARDWQWDLYAKALSGWKEGVMRFPFQHKTLVEPGTTLFYNSARQLFVLNAFYDSMLIKNYAKGISQLLLFGKIESGYCYRFNHSYHPELEGRIGCSFYHDSLHNIQNRQDLWIRTGLPRWPEIFSVIYHFEHAGFTHLSPNYYSYKNKWFQGLGLQLYYDFSSNGYLQLFYEHTWDLTLNLFEPIGSFLYIAPRQYLNGNKIYSALGFSKDRCTLEFSGHYFQNNLPYADWNIKGSFQWQF